MDKENRVLRGGPDAIPTIVIDDKVYLSFSEGEIESALYDAAKKKLMARNR